MPTATLPKGSARRESRGFVSNKPIIVSAAWRLVGGRGEPHHPGMGRPTSMAQDRGLHRPRPDFFQILSEGVHRFEKMHRDSNLQYCSAEPRPSLGRIESESEPPNLATEKNIGRSIF